MDFRRQKKSIALISLLPLASLCEPALAYRIAAPSNEHTGCHFYQFHYHSDLESAKAACQALVPRSSCVGAAGSFNIPSNTLSVMTTNWVAKEAGSKCIGSNGNPQEFTMHFFVSPTYILEPAPGNNSCEDNPREGNPIGLTNGNKLQNFHDISSGDITFTRTYNSKKYNSRSEMGTNFNHGFEVKASFNLTSQSEPIERAETYAIGTFLLQTKQDETFATTGNHPIAKHLQKYSRGWSRSTACSVGWPAMREEFRNGILNTAAIKARVIDHGLCQVYDENSGTAYAEFSIEPITGLTDESATDHVTVALPNGAVHTFTMIDGQYVPRIRSKVLLTQAMDGLAFSHADGTVDILVDGYLKKRTLPNGTQIDVEYILGEIKTATDNRGNRLVFTHTEDGLLESVSNGHTVISYGYDSTAKLIEVKRNNELVERYHYEDSRFPSFLTGITGANGKRYATWRYDADGRAISSEHAGGLDKYTIDYSNYDQLNSPYIDTTNPLGKKTSYHYDYINGQRRVTQVEGHPSDNCAAANKAYTYYDNGTLKTKTDWQGRVTEFIRDDYGREIERIEAKGTLDSRTIKTEWHPTLNVKTKVIEPKTTTEWEYFDDGKLKSTKTYATAN